MSMDEHSSLLPAIEYELMLLSRHWARYPLRPGALEQSGYLLLARLELDHPLSIRRLAEAFQLDVSTVQRQVAQLHKQGFVEYVLVPNAGATRRVQPTASGLAQLHGERERRWQGLERVIGEWPIEDLTRLHDVLLRFNQEIEELMTPAWPRPGESLSAMPLGNEEAPVGDRPSGEERP